MTAEAGRVARGRGRLRGRWSAVGAADARLPPWERRRPRAATNARAERAFVGNAEEDGASRAEGLPHEDGGAPVRQQGITPAWSSAGAADAEDFHMPVGEVFPGVDRQTKMGMHIDQAAIRFALLKIGEARERGLIRFLQ